MTKLIPICIFSIVMAAIAYYCRWRADGDINIDIAENKYIRNNDASNAGLIETGTQPGRLFIVMMAVAMILFCGLRTRYNDTGTYRFAYERMVAFPDMSGLRLSLNGYYGFEITSRVIKALGFSTQSYLMVFAAFTVGVYVWFLNKYCHNILYSTFMFLMIGGYFFTLAAMKQTTATAFCLLAIDQYLKGNKKAFVVLLIVGYTFHPFCIVYAAVPFLMFPPGSNKTILLLVLTGMVCIFLRPSVGIIADIASDMGNTYTSESFAGEGVNIFRVLVCNVPLVLVMLNRGAYLENTDEVKCLILNLAMVNGMIMFVGLFGTANYFARLANYFSMFQALSIPYIIDDYSEGSKGILVLGSIVGYFGFFYYGNAINQPFDLYFQTMRLADYLRLIF